MAVEAFNARSGGISPETSKPRGIEIPTVSEELYRRTREALKQLGYDFIVPIRSVSIKDLLREDRQREQDGKPRRLDHVNGSKKMQDTVPPEMEVAINPARFKIEKSNRLPTDEQIVRIKREEANLKEQLPEGIRPLVKMVMGDPSTLSQLEDAYMEAKNKLLFPDYFVRTYVETVQGRVAFVGRVGPADQRYVSDWRRDDGDGDLFAASMVVLPRKLAV